MQETGKGAAWVDKTSGLVVLGCRACLETNSWDNAGITTDGRQGCRGCERRDSRNESLGSKPSENPSNGIKRRMECFAGEEADQLPDGQTCASYRQCVIHFQPDKSLQEAVLRHADTHHWIKGCFLSG